MTAAIVVSVLVTLLLWAAFRMWATARRLDRLHKRTEAAWAACIESFGRRIVAARALAATGRLPGDIAQELLTVSRAADRAQRQLRTEAELALESILGRLDIVDRGDLAAELADAQERVTLAVQFYNDAVRDTRSLRGSWFTRLFRLAGRARLPEYFGPEASLSGARAVTR